MSESLAYPIEHMCSLRFFLSLEMTVPSHIISMISKFISLYITYETATIASYYLCTIIISYAVIFVFF